MEEQGYMTMFLPAMLPLGMPLLMGLFEAFKETPTSAEPSEKESVAVDKAAATERARQTAIGSKQVPWWRRVLARCYCSRDIKIVASARRDERDVALLDEDTPDVAILALFSSAGARRVARRNPSV